MYVKAADLASTTDSPDWADIIQTYEKIIAAYLRKDILKMSAKSLMIKAVLASMAYEDVVGAEKKYDKFCFDDPSFQGSREGDVLMTCIQAVKDNDKQTFDNAIKEYNRVTPFGRVEKAMLAAIVDTFTSLKGGVEKGQELELPDEDDDDDELDLR